MKLENYKVEVLIKLIQQIIKQSKAKISQNVNNQMLWVYWEIGKRIINLEEENNIDNQSSRLLINDLSKKLTIRLGKGYSRSNLTYMRLFYLSYKSGVTVSHQLTWSHYIELLKVDNDLERGFYQKQAVHEKWSVRELRRQRNSALFQRYIFKLF